MPTHTEYLCVIVRHFHGRFEHVPLVTPNGDVLVTELNFEVSALHAHIV